MCGIVGFADKKLDKRVLETMVNQMIHRGPDGSGIYLDDTIALGHCRLAIIDIEGGKQPMKSKDGNLVCSFNGELYNYRELRAELIEKGYKFATKSDTEILLYGYQEWKEHLPMKLRGMFAFAIWEKKTKTLFCARDYFGIKPLYYYKKNDIFLFGSEIKSFLVHPAFEKQLNQAQLDLYLSYQYSPGNETFFENVYKLPPAHFLIWKEDKLQITRYWQPVFDAQMETTLDEWAQKIDNCVQESVKMHMLSDVEVGSFLSSGIDSSYLTSLSHVKKTFSIGFKNEKYDEGKEAHRFSQRLGVWNKVYQITPKEFWDSLPKIQYHMDEPLADASCVALYFLNREAAKHVKVCLSGEGADELFAGYHIYKEPFMCIWYDRIPLWIRQIIGAAAQSLPSVKGVNFLVRHSKPLSERYIGNTLIFNEKQKRQLLKGYSRKPASFALAEPFFHKMSEADEVTRMQFTDLHLWLVGDILLKADKMSMANSLELRVPFLDKKVFEIARQIPTKYKVNDKETKIALRRAVAHHIGKKQASREKKGFPVPVRDWLREERHAIKVRAYFESDMAEQFFHTKELKKLLDDHISGRRDNWRQIWCIYMFLIWYEIYFKKDYVK